MAKEILENEILSDDELDNVSGGTTHETLEIISYIGKVYCAGTNESGYLKPESVARYLKLRYGIDATISWDITKTDYGTCLGEGSPNQYSRDGQTINHQQVMAIIKDPYPVRPDNRMKLTPC